MRWRGERARVSGVGRRTEREMRTMLRRLGSASLRGCEMAETSKEGRRESERERETRREQKSEEAESSATNPCPGASSAYSARVIALAKLRLSLTKSYRSSKLGVGQWSIAARTEASLASSLMRREGKEKNGTTWIHTPLLLLLLLHYNATSPYTSAGSLP